MNQMYNTMKFSDIYENVDIFIDNYNKSPFNNSIEDSTCRTLYYLLYAAYGNNPIANNDINQFNIKLFSIVFQFGPTWEKRLDIQQQLRNLSIDELRQGNKEILNQSLNPDSDPTTEELTYINTQNVSKSQRSILNAYNDLWQILKVDVTKDFIDKFKILFKFVVITENTLLYTTYEEE